MKKFITLSLIGLMALGCNMGNAQQEGLKNIKVSETEAIINQDNVVILDVRTPNEYSEGHVENSVNIDYYGDNFKEELEKLDKSKTYVVYCHSGKRSAGAADVMIGLGYTNVYNILGGIAAWENAKMPVVK